MDAKLYELMKEAGYAAPELASRAIKLVGLVSSDYQKRINELEVENRDACIGLNDYYGQQLAVAQAQLVKMRDQLAMIAWSNDSLWQSQAAREALAQPTDTTALREMLAKEREACAVVCEKSDRYRGDYFAAKIRARGESK